MDSTERRIYEEDFRKWCDYPDPGGGWQGGFTVAPTLDNAIVWMKETEKGRELAKKLAQEIDAEEQRKIEENLPF